VPRLVKIWIESKFGSVTNQPAIDYAINLELSVPVCGTDRLSTDIKVECAAGEVRTVDGKSGAAGVG
jgi:hypothetical protein